jgi:hypothetical protein
VWDLTGGGTIVSSTGAEYRLTETDLAGDTLRVLTGPMAELREVPSREAIDSARALAARLDSLPVPIDDVIGVGEGVRERRLPQRLPTMIGVFVAQDESVWVEQWPAEGRHGSRFYDILDDQGRLERRVVLDAPLLRDPSPFFGSGEVVGVVRDEETGVERVVRFTISAQSDRVQGQ